MKRSQFSKQQIAFVFSTGGGRDSLAEVSRKTGIGEAHYYVWRKKFGGLVLSEMKRLKQLEEENVEADCLASTRSCFKTRSHVWSAPSGKPHMRRWESSGSFLGDQSPPVVFRHPEVLSPLA